ncbi:hypothetical protein Dfulv_18975 [Dactylosporangium fulvum]|uniref:DUF4328 domain-containing protein n=1 Tax=Dactylosporangium fulvum TaxID=53359 RepID=A0ABY5W8K2_9ACTN|nr:hypothetical protein [Dactylosporangium fulvum]UWP86207.1 hypothetical protein Dfulv_18975 [Dactylosporangium fulvum]
MPTLCVRCGAPGYPVPGDGPGPCCARHGGVPSAAEVAALVAGAGPRRPAWWWRVCTWLFVAVTVIHIGLLAVHIRVLRRAVAVAERFVEDPGAITHPDVAAVLDLAQLLANVLRDGLWVYLVLFVLWFATVGREATRLGHDRHAVLRHWTYHLWRITLVPLIVAVVLAGRVLPDDADPAAFRDAVVAAGTTATAFNALRIVALTLVVGYAVVVWRRLGATRRRGASTVP